MRTVFDVVGLGSHTLGRQLVVELPAVLSPSKGKWSSLINYGSDERRLRQQNNPCFHLGLLLVKLYVLCGVCGF